VSVLHVQSVLRAPHCQLAVRVNADLRLIVHKTDASLLLCYVDHHDRAYAWAERRKLEAHPATGAAQIVELRESVREVVVPAYVQAAATPKAATKPLVGMSDDALLGYGVPTEWLKDVREADKDRLGLNRLETPVICRRCTTPSVTCCTWPALGHEIVCRLAPSSRLQRSWPIWQRSEQSRHSHEQPGLACLIECRDRTRPGSAEALTPGGVIDEPTPILSLWPDHAMQGGCQSGRPACRAYGLKVAKRPGYPPLSTIVAR
jgi:hypothetical protein